MTDPGLTYGTSTTQPPASPDKLRLQQALRGPASWFVTVAALSVLNSILSMSGASLHFIFGLGITQIVDSLAHQAGSAGYVLDVIINGIIAGLFVLIWNFARKGKSLAWYGGLAFYAIDGLILLLFKDYLSVAFHAYALFRMSPGLKLLPALRQLEQTTETGSISSTY